MGKRTFVGVAACSIVSGSFDAGEDGSERGSVAFVLFGFDGMDICFSAFAYWILLS